MVFGFGFSKEKVLASAEKNVKQGKLQNAIADYERVLKEDPKDLTVMNTVGDLYARVGNAEKATEFFRKVGDFYSKDGFTVKAIAMYKKLTKQDPNAIEIVTRLAELYTQQGLNNDARAQYMQVAEYHLRNNDQNTAAKTFEKVLELDPENLGLQTRLAELLQKMGKRDEARDLYFRTAEALKTRGALDQADDALGKVLNIDPAFASAIQLRGQVKLVSGDPQGAVHILTQMPDLDSRPDALRTLLKAQLELGHLEEAEPTSRKLLQVFNDPSGAADFAEALMASGAYEQAVKFYRDNADRLIMADSARVVQGLQAATSRVKSDPALLETVADLLQRAGNSSNLAEVFELLAHAYVQQGNLKSAYELYQKLTNMEPQNPQHTKNLRQVQAKLSEVDPTAVAAPLAAASDDGEGPSAIEEIEAAAVIVQKYPEDLADAIDGALTDSELFDSYNVVPKAIPPLERVLPRAPLDIRLNRRLASLYSRNGQLKEASERCQALEQVYADAGHVNDARQFGQLAAKFRRRAGLPAVEVARPEQETAKQEAAKSNATPKQSLDGAPARVVAVEEVAKPATPTRQVVPAVPIVPEPEPEPAIKEFDLSAEWDELAETETPDKAEVEAVEAESVGDGSVAVWDSLEEGGAADGTVAEVLDEIRFYIAQGMWREAEAAAARCEAIAPGNAELRKLKAELAAGDSSAGPSTVEVLGNSGAPAGTQEQIRVVAGPVPELMDSSGGLVGREREIDRGRVATSELLETFAVEPEKQSETVQLEPPAVRPQPPVSVAAKPGGVETGKADERVAADRSGESDLFGGFVSSLEESLGDFELAPPTSTPKVKIAAAATPEPVRGETPKAAPPVAAVPVASVQTVQPAPAPVAAPVIMAAAPPVEASVAQEEPGALAEVFAEFKESMETGADSEEDLDTHYNLGLAFKEMGLLDEAIGELQKVCQGVERGRAFGQPIQAYTWLADCFLQKGVPEAAVRWYEKALKTGILEQETATAIHYELACAHEVAGNKAAALQHFLEVYGSNIDYRDVAERIKGLKS